MGQKYNMYAQWCGRSELARQYQTKGVASGSASASASGSGSDGSGELSSDAQVQTVQQQNDEKRNALLRQNVLRSMSEQKEFLNLDAKTLEQILKLDSTADASKTTKPGKGTQGTTTTTTMEDLEMGIKMACSVVRRVYG